MRAIGASSPLIRSARSCSLIPSLSPTSTRIPFPATSIVKTRHVSPLIKRSEKPALLSLKLVSGAPRVRATSRPSSDQI